MLKTASLHSITALLREQKSTLYFLGASFGGSILGFFLLPLFTKYLPVEAFAVIGFAFALNTFVGPLFTLSFNSFYIKEYNKELVDGKPTASIFSSIFLFSMGWSVLLLGALAILMPLAFYLLSISIPFYPSVFLVLLTGLFQIPFTYHLLELRLERKARAYFWVSFIQSVSCLILPLAFVIYYQPTADSRLLGYAIAFLAVAVYCFVRIRPKLGGAIDWKLIGRAFRFSAPLILYSFAYLSFDFIDRYFIEQFNASLKVLGFYNVGFQFANLVFVFSVAIYRAYEPNYYRLYYEKQFAKLNRLLDYTNYVIWGAGLATLLMLPFIVELFTSNDYSLSVEMGRWLILATILQGVNTVYQTYYAIAGKTFSLMIVSVISLALYMAAGYFFSKNYQYHGTIWVKIAIQLFIMVVSFFSFFQRLKSSRSFYLTMILSFVMLAVLYLYE
ncbi:MAG TPA: oligosaccharide flippase family protein [Flavisolibacter sp.]|nr:oligosaccharide flippase family protein [Flavisolibacter sp.]